MPMSYEQFKEKVLAEFMGKMPTEYQNMEVTCQEVNKVNQKLDGITLLNPESETNISPTLYINYMYDEYLENGDFDAVISKAAEDMVHGFEITPKIFSPDDLVNKKDKITFQLINSERNQDLLANVPSRAFEDLSIIYRLVVEKDGFGVASAVVTNELMESMHLSENELYNLAKVNTPELFEPFIQGMSEFMNNEMGMDMGIPESEEAMWIVSNEQKFNGAAVILYDDVLKELSEKLGEDIYVLPSSTHECLAVRASEHELRDLEQMVKEVNNTMLLPGDVLSDSVYYYDQKERTLTIATAEREQEKLPDQEIANRLEDKIMSALSEIDDMSGDKQIENDLTGGFREESVAYE